jgi:hypothetical protein
VKEAKEEGTNNDLMLSAPMDRLSYCIKNAMFLRYTKGKNNLLSRRKKRLLLL